AFAPSLSLKPSTYFRTGHFSVIAVCIKSLNGLDLWAELWNTKQGWNLENTPHLLFTIERKQCF
ncbi:hypothetical protein V5096_16870, partial [Pseudoalteromonas carrageenovora]|uniref:hypothetical protein n=1 Tax=Pseudoalteromonas carrageenovora TaxID=227 RepID=UPI002FD47684